MIDIQLIARKNYLKITTNEHSEFVSAVRKDIHKRTIDNNPLSVLKTF